MKTPPVNNYSKIANFIAKKPVQKVIRYAEKNTALFQSGTVFTTASLLRPATILAVPTKNDEAKKDNLYSASKSVASGVTDLAFSTALFLPVNKVIDKISVQACNDKTSMIYNNQKACRMYKNLMNRGLKLAVVPIIAYLNFKYLKNIANFISQTIFPIGKDNENK